MTEYTNTHIIAVTRKEFPIWAVQYTIDVARDKIFIDMCIEDFGFELHDRNVLIVPRVDDGTYWRPARFGDWLVRERDGEWNVYRDEFFKVEFREWREDTDGRIPKRIFQMW